MKRIFIPLLVVLAAAACQEGTLDQPQSLADVEMSFDVRTPGPQTKVTSEAFEESDVIGLYVTDYVNDATSAPLQISGNRANNLPVTYDGAVWTPEKKIWWGEGKSDVYAYYPYMDISDVESQYFEVAADQTLGGYEASDLLWAKAEGVRQTDGPVNLQMKHLMSKLTVKIVAGEDYVGSLPSDASVLLHSTVTGARVDLSKGSVSKDPYSSVRSIKMKNLGIRTFGGTGAVVYEAVVVPQMLETSVPLLEINSKSVSYLLEDSFNFRPGVAYTYTVTLNTSTTAIKVEIGCELEDWNSTGGGSGEGEEGGDGPGEEVDGKTYTDLSAPGTANCYLVRGTGDYKFKTVIGNFDATVGNVKTVEVLWESFGTDEMPNVGDLIESVSYKDGYIRFSTPETFREGNAVIAAKNSKGTILWSWHIWLAEEGWEESVYPNDAGTMMDRNLGAISATPGHVGALGLYYQYGRKDPFLGSSSISSGVKALSTGTWLFESSANVDIAEENPMTFYETLSSHVWTLSDSPKAISDPCPAGWRLPDGGSNGVWAKAGFADMPFDSQNMGILFNIGSSSVTWYPASGYVSSTGLNDIGSSGYFLSASPLKTDGFGDLYILEFNMSSVRTSATNLSNDRAYPVRCQKDVQK